MEQEHLQTKDILDYYKSSMPYCDREDVPEEVLAAYAQHALFLREEVEWCKELPNDIFLENVAAYRVNSERIEDCRRWFYDLVMPLLAGLTLEEAVLKVNLWCSANATYHQADARTANAVTVYKSGYGRCGEESTFAVTVLRSVGIAARQVYAPLWSHCDDNHAWVEVWCDGRWQYFGACEPEPVLNRGWFDLPASKAMLVHAKTFGEPQGQQEGIGRTGSVTYYNVTAHYGKTAEIVFFCTDETGEPLVKMPIKLKVLNYAHFGTIATLHTDETGRLFARLGLGSLRLSCMRTVPDTSGEEHAGQADKQQGTRPQEISALFRVEKSGEFTIKLDVQPQDVWIGEQFFAPEGSVKEDDEAGALVFAEFQDQVEAAKASREQRISSYYDPERGGRYPEAEEILRTAGGNFEELIRFLEIDDDPYRLKLLKALTEKDYYDCKADMLQEHLEDALSFAGQEGIEDDIFVKYVLCPRIEHEELSCWRRTLAKELSEKKAAYRENPCLIWDEICSTLCPPKDDAYETLRMQPVSTYKSKKGSFADQRILFVAIARSLGIPARLNPETGEPEFYQDGRFTPVIVAAQDGVCSRLTFLSEEGKSWTYWTDWCLEYLKEDGYFPLDLQEEQWEKENLSIQAKEGFYRITTVIRLANGDQMEKEYCFRMGKEDSTIALERYDLDRDTQAKELTNIEICVGEERTDLNSLRNGKRAACIWIREGEEPTEHILNEMLERISDVKNVHDRIFLLSMEKAKPAGTLERLLQTAEGIGFYLVENFDGAKQAAEAMGVKQLEYPLAVSMNEAGKGIYVTCGYNVGSVAQLLLRL